ncbi:uncharacterized protein LOC114259048 [Camellia sinensis]|uniref:uncharacterized protein LOC114259048 n=1 Tax=Camellia sinensis TaxID=4442 RepID=UPI001035A712|nr:uncharacterized protein LOC114259048 [Camellia sinensis]
MPLRFLFPIRLLSFSSFLLFFLFLCLLLSRELRPFLSLFSLHCWSTFKFRVGIIRVRFCNSVVNESRRARRNLCNGSLGFMIGQDLPSRSSFLHYLRALVGLLHSFRFKDYIISFQVFEELRVDSWRSGDSIAWTSRAFI